MIKLYRCLLLALLLVTPMVWGQQTNTQEVLSQFATNKKVQWVMPFGVETPTVEWYERANSLQKHTGIRTFTGYHNGSLLGVLSVSQGVAEGHITWNGALYNIATQNGEVTVIREKEAQAHGSCGTCTDGSCDAEAATKMPPRLKAMRRTIDKMAVSDIPEIHSDGVLKVYRLALLVDYDMYAYHFQSDANAVKRFWASTEVFLNELYQRDVAIKFEVLQDDRLIIDNVAQQKFRSWWGAGSILNGTTEAINGLIGINSYDIGVSLPNTSFGVNGQAAMYGAFSVSNKAAACAIARESTIAHEIGHLFGTDHTFTYGGGNTMNTEPGRGTSIMSYNFTVPRDFFSLASAYYIRNAMLNNADYYTTVARTEKKGPGNAENVVYGIATDNRPPVIDRSKLKETYTIPRDTYFQFKISATDPDDDKLLYMAHQVDFRRYQTSNAQFISRKPTENSTIVFEPIYGSNFMPIEYTTPSTYLTGEFTFWLGVSDGGELSIPNNENHATRYDMYRTVLKIVNGTPFKFVTSSLKNRYTSGEKTTLQWTVDNNVFGTDSKVRILMSDDFGATYKYVLADNVPNNGSCEVVIPAMLLGKKEHRANTFTGLGLFKIEVKDHIAHTISNNNPLSSTAGFEIVASPITFQNLPEQTITVAKGQVPTKQEVTATSTNGNVTVVYEENETEGLVVRTWTATDGANNTSTFKQFIYVEQKVKPLEFETELPAELHVQCKDDVPEVPELKVRGGSNPKVQFIQTRLKDDYENFILKRTWVVTDPVAAPISHTQHIFVVDNIKPVFSHLPPDMKVDSYYTYYLAEPQMTAYDNCQGEVVVEKSGPSAESGPEGMVYIYKWKAKDASGNEAVHEQRVIMNSTFCNQVVNGAKVEELLASEDCVGGYTAQQLADLKRVYEVYKTNVNDCNARTSVINAVAAVERLSKITFDSKKLYRIYNVRTNNEVLYANYETNQVATRTNSDPSKVDELWTLSATNGSVTITNPNTQTSISANGELGSGTLTLSDAGVAKFAIAGLLTTPVIRLKEVESISLPITKKYATLCLPFAVEIPSNSSATFYRVGDVSGNAVNIISLSGVIPANMPVIVRDDNNGTHNLNIAYRNATPATTNATDGVLKGVLKPTTIPADAFILWTNGRDETGFYRVESTNEKLAANRAYLLLSNAGQSYYQINITDGKSSIINIEDEVNKRVQYFDLSGRPVTVLVPGVVYLTSEGKKVIFKRK